MIFESKIIDRYKKNFLIRFDENPLLHYYDISDFPGLCREPFAFLGNNGQRLQGYFYHYKAPLKDRLIIFDHGIGNGHVAYMKEIELCARRGYTVFAYDHTGCRESEGASITGFAQSLADLDYAVNALHTAKGIEGGISVIGHSWGGFASLNISALHPEIESCVSLAGLIGIEPMIRQLLPGPLCLYRSAILRLEREANPIYSLIDARRSLKGTRARILYIASRDDPTVKARYHFDALRKVLGDEPRLELLLLNGKRHNPNYTERAVAELERMTAAMTEGMKRKRFKTPEDAARFKASRDWELMTEQDMSV